MRRIFLAVLLLELAFAGPAFSQQNWSRTYGGRWDDEAYSVRQTFDGGYIIAGWARSFPGSDTLPDIYLVKTNSMGDTLWTKDYHKRGTEYSYAVWQTSDSGYIITGCTNWLGMGTGDALLLKTNSSGDSLWSRTFGGTGYDAGWSVKQTSDGGYIVAGWKFSSGDSFQVYLIKTNPFGDTLWTKTYGGTNAERGYSVQQTSDGGYIVAGYTRSFGAGNDDVYLIKTDASGDTLWTKTYGGTNAEYGMSCQQTSDGGYIIAGYTDSFGSGGGDFYLIKTNASGNLVWSRTYGGGSFDWGNSVQQTSDNGYIIVGYTASFGAIYNDVYIVKTNSAGDTLWTRRRGGANYDWGYSVQQTSDGGYIVAGYTNSFGAGGDDFYLIKIDAQGGSGIEETNRFNVFFGGAYSATPNPFVSFTRVPVHKAERLALYDITGRKVCVCKDDRVGEELSPGVYFLKAENENSKPLRIVKVR